MLIDSDQQVIPSYNERILSRLNLTAQLSERLLGSRHQDVRERIPGDAVGKSLPRFRVQEQMEEDVKRAWKVDPLLNRTISVQSEIVPRKQLKTKE